MENNETIRRTIIFGEDAVEYLEENNIPAEKAEEALDKEDFSYGIAEYDYTKDQWEAYFNALADMNGWNDYKIY